MNDGTPLMKSRYLSAVSVRKDAPIGPCHAPLSLDYLCQQVVGCGYKYQDLSILIPSSSYSLQSTIAEGGQEFSILCLSIERLLLRLRRRAEHNDKVCCWRGHGRMKNNEDVASCRIYIEQSGLR